MKFNKDLVFFRDEDVFYDGIKLSITRQNIQDYMLQDKGVRLDLSVETIQDTHHGSITEEEFGKVISNSYKRCLGIHREKLLKDLLNDKNKKHNQ